ncbi:MAG TPA: flagellar basal body rod protein FlgC [Caldithrix abyssi]|uniref:Flagellar basal-body rod protein FlgC n=1 Tax=Caldithrix abyssi TaxID=187145 RepID=A0A7V1LJE0_CALAY|nr:flagellar basal body rod protein FlgC [Caldithrix abyssi]
MKTEGILSAIDTTMGGLSTQMKRLRLISDNIANADRIADKKGKVYKRQILVPEGRNSVRKPDFGDRLSLSMKKTAQGHFNNVERRLGGLKDGRNDYEVIQQESTLRVFEPNNPMADKDGYVEKPDINVVEEMVDMISATRIYEANISVMEAAKSIAKKSMEI